MKMQIINIPADKFEKVKVDIFKLLEENGIKANEAYINDITQSIIYIKPIKQTPNY